MPPYELLVREGQEVLNLSQTTATALGHASQLHGKSLLLMTPHTWATGHEEINVIANRGLSDN